MDAVEAPSSPSQLPSHFSQCRHFYVAVDRLQFKMETFVDLLGVTGRRPWLPMVVCCSSRDELDAVCAAVSNIPFISVTSLHSDLSESERGQILESLRRATLVWSQTATDQPRDDSQSGDQKSHMVVVTDACLPLLASGESPMSAHILINYELPVKKESYSRRMTTCLAADGVVINMVVGGEVVTLKSIEESSSLIIAEMPINISDIL